MISPICYSLGLSEWRCLTFLEIDKQEDITDYSTVIHENGNSGLFISDLKPWSTYVFRIKFINSIGSSKFSEDSDQIVLPEAPPAIAPPNVEVEALNATAIQVSFSKIPLDAANGDILEYNVYYYYAATHRRQKNVAVKDSGVVSINNLATYEEVVVQVSAKTVAGEGPKSDKMNVKTKEGTPSATIKLKCGSTKKRDCVTATTIKLNWSSIKSTYWKGPAKYYVVCFILYSF